MNGKDSRRTGILRLRHLQEVTEAHGEEMAARRERFARLADPSSAPRAVSAFNLFQTPPELAERLAEKRDFLYLGRGINYPIALEGALKLKEISYIHAEGYPAGEMKHGPIALIDEDLPVVAVAADDGVFEKALGNIQEAKARLRAMGVEVRL